MELIHCNNGLSQCITPLPMDASGKMSDYEFLCWVSAKINEIIKKIQDIQTQDETPIDVTTIGFINDGVTDNAKFVSNLVSGGYYYFPAGTYLFSQCKFPDNIKIINNGTFYETGMTPTNQYVLTFGKTTYIDTLRLRMSSGNANYRYGVSLSENSVIGTIALYSDGYVNSEGVHLNGNNIRIESIKSTGVSRVCTLGAYNDILPATGLTQDGLAFYSGCYVMHIYCDSVVQGVRIGRLNGGGIMDITAFGNENISISPQPGYNLLYISASKNIYVNQLILHNSLEHAVRIGGDDNGSEITEHIMFNQIYSEKAGGSALKINPGFNQVCNDIYVNSLYVKNNGLRDGTINRRSSSLRVSHATNVTVNNITSYSDSELVAQYPNSSEIDCIEINNVNNLYVNSVNTNYFLRSVVSFDENNDSTVGENGLSSLSQQHTDHVVIKNVYSSWSDGSYIYRAVNTEEAFDNVQIENCKVYANNVGTASSVDNLTGIIYLFSINNASNRSSSSLTIVSLSHDFASSNRFIGVPLDIDEAWNTGVLLNISNTGEITAGNYGAAITFLRNYSERPGVTLASVQNSTNYNDVALALLFPMVNASNGLTEILRFANDGVFPYTSNLISLGDVGKKFRNLYVYRVTSSVNNMEVSIGETNYTVTTAPSTSQGVPGWSTSIQDLFTYTWNQNGMFRDGSLFYNFKVITPTASTLPEGISFQSYRFYQINDMLYYYVRLIVNSGVEVDTMTLFTNVGNTVELIGNNVQVSTATVNKLTTFTFDMVTKFNSSGSMIFDNLYSTHTSFDQNVRLVSEGLIPLTLLP